MINSPNFAYVNIHVLKERIFGITAMIVCCALSLARAAHATDSAVKMAAAEGARSGWSRTGRPQTGPL